MFFLNDISNFSSITNPKPRKKRIGVIGKLRKNTLNPDVANAAVVGGSLGLIGSAIGGGSTKLNKIGAGVGLAAGTGLGIANKYRKNKNY
jgi:hypothetical protein